MPLRIGKLANKKPVKITLAIDPALYEALRDYAAIYAQTYGQKEKIEALASVMLERFLESDSVFKRARKSLNQH